MKILDVAEFYSKRGGGVKTYLNGQMSFGARYGHEIVIVAPGAVDKVEQSDGGKIIWVKSPPTPDPRYRMFWRASPVIKVLERERPDIVVGSSPWMGGRIVSNWQGAAKKVMFMHQDPVAAYAHAILGRKIGHVRIDKMFGWYWRILKRLNDRYDATVVGSEWFANRLTQFGFRPPRIVPLGVDKELFLSKVPDPGLKADLLSSCGAPPDSKLLLAVSRLHPEKRLDIIFDAFGEVSAQQDVGLVILGDGPLRRRVERRAARMKGVCLKGFVPDRSELASIVACADALVHGGAFEPFGLAVAEGMCAGLPMVVPETGGAGELAMPEYSEKYPVNSASGCADALRHLLSRNLQEMSDASRSAAVDKVISSDEHFSRLFGLYSELLDRP